MLFYKPLVSLVTAIALTSTVTASATPVRETDDSQCTQYLYCCKGGVLWLVGLDCVLDSNWYFLGFRIQLVCRSDISCATARSTATTRRMKAVPESRTKKRTQPIVVHRSYEIATGKRRNKGIASPAQIVLVLPCQSQAFHDLAQWLFRHPRTDSGRDYKTSDGGSDVGRDCHLLDTLQFVAGPRHHLICQRTREGRRDFMARENKHWVGLVSKMAEVFGRADGILGWSDTTERRASIQARLYKARRISGPDSSHEWGWRSIASVK
ncbi:hypothetical protein EDB85DRAFT_1894475 [Lactarius pseudohatsudake]|nr:hypothetical protein EDB85DRAFT_1894475 [Lactarius pseudohatsudake]